MNRLHMMISSMMMCSAIGMVMPAKAAPLANGFIRAPALQPSQLLPKVECDAAESAKICDVRRAAAARALEVLLEDAARANGPRRLGTAPLPENQSPTRQPKLTPISM